jgi:hypothetical protein
MSLIFSYGSPLPRRTHRPFPLCHQGYLQAAPANAAVLAMLRSGHLPESPLDDLPGHPDRLAPAKSCTDSICTWCHSGMTLPKSPILPAIFPGCTLPATLPHVLLGWCSRAGQP